MVSINYASREVSCKIVYYGPGLSGKTTNLQYVHKKVPANTKGKLISLATDADRTLYFDFLPINIGTINGFAAKFQLYTVPGQVYYNATRKLVLRGVDGLVFVADSQPDKMDENVESFNNLKENLAEYGYNLDEIPIVIQYNKQDLSGVLTPEQISPTLNPRGWPEFKASATVGFGVFDTLKCILKLVLEKAKSGGTVPNATGMTQAAPPSSRQPLAAAQAPEVPRAESVPHQTPSPPQTEPPMHQPPPQVSPQPASTQPPPDNADERPAYGPVPSTTQAQQQTIDSPVGQAPTPENATTREEYVQTPESQEPAYQMTAAPRAESSYRPFPGNTAEDEQMMRNRHQYEATAVRPDPDPVELSTDAGPVAEQSVDRPIESDIPTGKPRMEPSMRVEKARKPKKKSFFKRLFGLK